MFLLFQKQMSCWNVYSNSHGYSQRYKKCDFFCFVLKLRFWKRSGVGACASKTIGHRHLLDIHLDWPPSKLNKNNTIRGKRGKKTKTHLLTGALFAVVIGQHAFVSERFVIFSGSIPRTNRVVVGAAFLHARRFLLQRSFRRTFGRFGVRGSQYQRCETKHENIMW